MKKKGKIVVLLSIGLFLIVCFNGVYYLNLKVSEKYETQPAGLDKSVEAAQLAAARDIEINKEKSLSGYIAIISLLSLYLIGIYWVRSGNAGQVPKNE